MRYLSDLKNLSEVILKPHQRFQTDLKLMKIYSSLEKLSLIYKEKGIDEMIIHILENIRINIRGFVPSALCMFTIFFFIAMIPMSILHENRQKKWTIIPLLICIAIVHLLFIMKYLFYMPVGFTDIIDMFICTLLAVAFMLYVLLMRRMSCCKLIGVFLLTDIYQIVYGLTGSDGVLYFPIILIGLYATLTSSNLRTKLVSSITTINHVFLVVSHIIPFDYLSIYHLINIPCLFLIWFILLQPDEHPEEEQTRMYEQYMQMENDQKVKME